REGQRAMFEVASNWWAEQDQEDYAMRLSKEGVRTGETHEEDDGSGMPGGRSHSHGGCAHHHQSSYQEQGGYSEEYAANQSYGQSYGDGGYGGGYEQQQEQEQGPADQIGEIIEGVQEAKKLMGMFGF